jgi:drug/metabolite transporter (DMT)-like permease
MISSGVRFALAGLLLLAIDVGRRRPIPPLRDWIRAVPVGVLLLGGGNGFVALAERTAPSGAAALACALAPVWAAVLALPSGDRPRKRQWIGFALGVAGVAILSAGALPDRASAIYLGIAPLCWALGTVIAKRVGGSASLPLITGGVAMGIWGVLSKEAIPASIPMSAWIAWLYLVSFGSMLAFTAYAYLVRHAPTPLAMSYAYVNPVLAVILGAVLGGEALGPSVIASAGLVTLAVIMIVRRPNP